MIVFFTIWGAFPFSELHFPTKISAGINDYNCMHNCKGVWGHTLREIIEKMMQFDVFWCIF